MDSLKKAIRSAYMDVLEETDCKDMILLVKSEQWQGEFVELHGDMKVADDSTILKLSFDSPKEVSY